jgi:16S rRNA (cytosine967-C5)-methyltransferase
MENAAKLVKTGGVLVYSTCTIEPEENIGLINEFLLQHSEFTIEPGNDSIHQDIIGNQGQVETFRHKHGMDGSFSVRLRKK